MTVVGGDDELLLEGIGELRSPIISNLVLLEFEGSEVFAVLESLDEPVAPDIANLTVHEIDIAKLDAERQCFEQQGKVMIIPTQPRVCADL